MFETTVTFEVTNALARDEHSLLAIGLPAQAELDTRSGDIAPRHPEMKWITTERGLEARWAGTPGRAGAFCPAGAPDRSSGPSGAVLTSETMTEGALFHRCRKALGLSLNEMARALLIAGNRNIRRWEDGHHAVSGPAWVAFEHLLRNHGETALADQVAAVVQQRRASRAPSGARPRSAVEPG